MIDNISLYPFNFFLYFCSMSQGLFCENEELCEAHASALQMSSW